MTVLWCSGACPPCSKPGELKFSSGKLKVSFWEIVMVGFLVRLVSFPSGRYFFMSHCSFGKCFLNMPIRALPHFRNLLWNWQDKKYQAFLHLCTTHFPSIASYSSLVCWIVKQNIYSPKYVIVIAHLLGVTFLLYRENILQGLLNRNFVASSCCLLFELFFINVAHWSLPNHGMMSTMKSITLNQAFAI